MRTIFQSLAPGAVGLKICGVTNFEDAAVCVDAGVDAVGFNFYPLSKRFLDLEAERHWLKRVPESVFRVAVMVNPSEEEARALLSEPFIDGLQLHGEETATFCETIQRQAGKQVIKALRVENAATLHLADDYASFPLLLDAFQNGERGGTGHSFDWKWLADFSFLDQMILSGGLNLSNVEAALRLTGARFIDVASGSEEDPRQKSQRKIDLLVSAVRKSGF